MDITDYEASIFPEHVHLRLTRASALICAQELVFAGVVYPLRGFLGNGEFDENWVPLPGRDYRQELGLPLDGDLLTHEEFDACLAWTANIMEEPPLSGEDCAALASLMGVKSSRDDILQGVLGMAEGHLFAPEQIVAAVAPHAKITHFWATANADIVGAPGPILDDVQPSTQALSLIAEVASKA